MRPALIILAVALLGGALLPGSVSRADEPGELIQSIEQSLGTAGKFYREKNYHDATAALEEAKSTFETLGAATMPDDLRPQVDKLDKRLVAAERLIAKLKPAPAKTTPTAKKKVSAAPTSRAAAKTKKSARTKQPSGVAPPAPSFTADVAPILIAHCGNCHIRNARGGLSMASFANLAKGNHNGPIVTPGASQASRLVDVIFSGRMPPGGGQMSPDELTVISLWIDAGAQFDGGDPTAPLGQPAPMSVRGGPAAGNGPQGVQFLRDLAPALVTNCMDCHAGEKAGGQFRLETFAALASGGASGKVIQPGNARDSLLIKRLRGLNGDRMPKDKPALSAEMIDRFELWISNGAKFDGPDQTMSLKAAVEKAALAQMSHEELTAKHVARTDTIWSQAFPDTPAEQLQTDNFILRGNVSAKRLETVAKLAEAERAKIVKLLKLADDAPLVKGCLPLFVFRQSADYGEFVRTVEAREAPSGVSGHAQVKDADLYACLIVTSAGDELPALVAEQVAAGFISSLSDVPSWFVAGAGRTIAARVESKNSLLKKWEGETEKLSAPAGAEAFASTTPIDAETAARSYVFVRSLTKKLPQFQSLVVALGQGQDFDQSLASVYRHDSSELVKLWLRSKPFGR